MLWMFIYGEHFLSTVKNLWEKAQLKQSWKNKFFSALKNK